MPNFTLFCRKSELCCNFVLFGVVLVAFIMVNFYFYFKKRNQSNYLHNSYFYRCVVVLFCSVWLSNTFYAVLLQIYFCQNLRTFLDKIILDNTLLVSKNSLFSCPMLLFFGIFLTLPVFMFFFNDFSTDSDCPTLSHHQLFS